jgi:hypothetical protein
MTHSKKSTRPSPLAGYRRIFFALFKAKRMHAAGIISSESS